MKRIMWWVGLLCLGLAAGAASAQGVRYEGNVTTAAKNVPMGSQAPVFTIPYAKVTICGDPPTPANAVCANVAPIYSDKALTLPLTQPIQANAQGGFGFWTAPGTYTYSMQNPHGDFLGDATFSLGISGGFYDVNEHQLTIPGGIIATGINITPAPAGCPTGQVMKGLNSDFSAICVAGGGGGSAPLGQQYRISGFTGSGTGGLTALGGTNSYTDATGNALTVPGPFLANIQRGEYTADQFQTGGGNNGFSGALSSSGFPSSGGKVVWSPGYTGSERFGYFNQFTVNPAYGLPQAFAWQDLRGGHNIQGFHNWTGDNYTGTAAATGEFCASDLRSNAQQFCRSTTLYSLNPGYNVGIGGSGIGPYGVKARLTTVRLWTAGIIGAEKIDALFNGSGDVQVHDDHAVWRNGWRWRNDEGRAWARVELLDGLDYKGHIEAGHSGTGLTDIILHCDDQCANLTMSEPLVNATTAISTTATVVSSTLGAVLVQTGASYAVSTITTLDAPVTVGDTPTSVTFTVDVASPLSVSAGTNLSIYGGGVGERSAVISVGTWASGKQTVTAILQWPHGAGESVAFGGLAGRVFVNTSDTQVIGSSSASYAQEILASTASNQMLVSVQIPNTYASRFVHIGAGMIYQACTIQGVADPNTYGQSMNGSYVKCSPSNMVLNVGDNVVGLSDASQTTSVVHGNVTSYNPQADMTYLDLGINGLGWSSGRIIRTSNGNPVTAYTYQGGTHSAPKTAEVIGVYAGEYHQFYPQIADYPSAPGLTSDRFFEGVPVGSTQTGFDLDTINVSQFGGGAAMQFHVNASTQTFEFLGANVSIPNMFTAGNQYTNSTITRLVASSGSAATAVPAKIIGNTYQSANLLEVSNTGGALLDKIDSTGHLDVVGITCGGVACSGGGGNPSVGSAGAVQMAGATTGTFADSGCTAATGTLSCAGYATVGTTPGEASLSAGTGSIPALSANSAGFAAPATGGASYLFKLPSAVPTAGVVHAAAVATGDGVSESNLSVALVTNADLANTTITVNGVACTLGSTCAPPSGSAPAVTVATVSGTYALTFASGADIAYDLTLSGNCTFTLTAPSTGSIARRIILWIHPAGFTATLPASSSSLAWAGGSPPAVTGTLTRIGFENIGGTVTLGAY